MAAPDKKYHDIFSSFSCISVNPARGHMQTSYADLRQSKLSKLLQNQIAQYTKMSTAFTSLSFVLSDLLQAKTDGFLVIERRK